MIKVILLQHYGESIINIIAHESESETKWCNIIQTELHNYKLVSDATRQFIEASEVVIVYKFIHYPEESVSSDQKYVEWEII